MSLAENSEPVVVTVAFPAAFPLVFPAVFRIVLMALLSRVAKIPALASEVASTHALLPTSTISETALDATVVTAPRMAVTALRATVTAPWLDVTAPRVAVIAPRVPVTAPRLVVTAEPVPAPVWAGTGTRGR